MKKILYLASALLVLSVMSCTKDDGAPDGSANMIRSYQVLCLSEGKVYAKDVYTPTFGPDGRIVKIVYEMYTISGDKAKLGRVNIMDFDYEASAAYATNCWEIMTPGDLSVIGPYKYSLEFDGGGKMKKVIENINTNYFAYDGDYLTSFKVTDQSTEIVNEYTWSGGDLVRMFQNTEYGPYNLTVTYGKELNPFSDTVDPIFAIYSSSLPAYSRWNLTGKTSTHLPATYKEDFYYDITFSFEYKKDDKGRIVQVDIKGDDEKGDFDKSIIINY